MTVRLALRLTLAGWRAAPWRIIVSVVGVGLAVVVLLAVLAVEPALRAQEERERRRNSPISEGQSEEPLLWAVNGNPDPTNAGGVTVIAVAARGPRAPLPLGADRVPGPNEVLVSPRLQSLLDGDSVLRHRLPGPVVGVLGREVLKDPNDLVMMIGRDPGNFEGASEIAGFSPRVPRPSTPKSTRPRQILTVVAGVGLVLPIFAFVHGSLLVGARRREERFAAMRLVGATLTDIRRAAAVEMMLGAALGSLVGIVSALLMRSAMSTPSVAGFHFFAEDLRPPGLAVGCLLLALPVMVGAATSSFTGLRPVRSTPRTRVRWALAAFVVGWAILVGAAQQSSSLTISSLGAAVAVGFAAVTVGFIGLSPAVVAAAARVMQRGERPGVLLATRRLQADPRGAARAVGGVAVAALVGVTALVYFPSHQNWAAETEGGSARGGSRSAVVRADVIVTGADGADLRDALRAVPGVSDVIPVAHAATGLGMVAVASCDRLLRAVRAQEPCDPTSAYSSAGAAPGSGPVLPVLGSLFPPVQRLVPPSRLGAEEVAGFAHWLLATDGRPETAERVRGMVLQRRPVNLQVSARTDAPVAVRSRSEADEAKLDLAAGFIFVIGAARFLLALVEGILGRRRELSMLVAQGTDVKVLRQASTLEFVLPMTMLCALGAAVGAGIAITILATGSIPPTARIGDVAIALVAFVGLTAVCSRVAALGVGRSLDLRALAGERA